MNQESTEIIKQNSAFSSIVKYRVSNTLELYQDSKHFVFVPNLEALKEFMEKLTGMEFHFITAKDTNYFYHFWLEPKKNQPIKCLQSTN